MYKLYTFSLSSTAWRARIALNLKKIQVEHHYVSLFKAENRTPEYRKINPNTVLTYRFRESPPSCSPTEPGS